MNKVQMTAHRAYLLALCGDRRDYRWSFDSYPRWFAYHRRRKESQ